MNLFKNQSWDELSRPARWGEPIRPAMEELETRLPALLALLGAGAWLHRNVSWSDLDRIEDPGTHPPAGDVWPLMYMVGYYRKARLGIHLKACKGCVPRSTGWKRMFSAAEGLSCIVYSVDPGDPSSMEPVLQDICREVQKVRIRQKPKWQCTAGPVHISKETVRFAWSGLVKEEKGVWIPTERGEDAGLITLFTAGKGGKTERSMRWTTSTQKALSGARTGPVALQTRIKRLEQGLACQDACAAKVVRKLAEMPLEDYFQDCPEVDASDLAKLQTVLGLEKGCLFRTAAATLFRRMRQAGDKKEMRRLQPLMGILALPVASAKMDEKEKRIVVEKFRKGQFLA